MKNNLHPNKSRGFTLIELLIVISIIGILAAVLIAVINPVAQQNKARDAGLKASLNKIGLAINAYNSAYNTYPPMNQFVGVEITNSVQQAIHAGAPTDAGAWVMFSINGVSAPATCADTYGSGGVTGLGARQCWFLLRSNSGCVSVKSYGDNTKYWVWQPNAGDVVLSAGWC